MARRDRRDGQPERGPEVQEPLEPERESVTALKGILAKLAPLVKPLGLTQEESTDLVQRMYESVLELDMRLAGEPDERRKDILIRHIRSAEISREDDRLVIAYPAPPAGTPPAAARPVHTAPSQADARPSLDPAPAASDGPAHSEAMQADGKVPTPPKRRSAPRKPASKDRPPRAAASADTTAPTPEKPEPHAPPEDS